MINRLIVTNEDYCPARTYNLRDGRRTAGRIVAALLRAGIECSRSTSTTDANRLDVVLTARDNATLADRVVATVVPRERWDVR